MTKVFYRPSNYCCVCKYTKKERCNSVGMKATLTCELTGKLRFVTDKCDVYVKEDKDAD